MCYIDINCWGPNNFFNFQLVLKYLFNVFKLFKKTFYLRPILNFI